MKIGRRVMYRREDVDRWMQERSGVDPLQAGVAALSFRVVNENLQVLFTLNSGVVLQQDGGTKRVDYDLRSGMMTRYAPDPRGTDGDVMLSFSLADGFARLSPEWCQPTSPAWRSSADR
jgi:hypothetical protein